MSDPNPQDLNALIDAASDTIDKKYSRPVPASRRSIFKPVLSLILLAVIVYAGMSVYGRLAPPGPAKVTRDLESVVEQARAAIEASRKATGEYPDALPNAALASVVEYDHEKDTYKLSATIMGIRVTLEPGGKKQIEKGVQ